MTQSIEEKVDRILEMTRAYDYPLFGLELVRESIIALVAEQVEKVKDVGVQELSWSAKDWRHLLEAERAKVSDLQEWLDDYENEARRIMNEECAPDERHCSCVPALKAEMERLRKVATEALTPPQAKLAENPEE